MSTPALLALEDGTLFRGVSVGAEGNTIGEVVIRGPNVTLGYLKNPDANATAFTNGWFRTGDQGVIDDEGYLRLTGRLKEIINRGGEKISPPRLMISFAHRDSMR